MLSIYEYNSYTIHLMMWHDYAIIFVYFDSDEIFYAKYNYKFGNESAFSLLVHTIEYITKKEFDVECCKLIERKLL